MMQKILELPEAEELARQMPYAWIRSYSELHLGPNPPQWDDTEWIEARFFDAESEIRFFRVEGSLYAAMVCTEPGDTVLRETYQAAGRQMRYTLSTILLPDEDGQMNPAAVFLSGWNGGDSLVTGTARTV